MMPVIKNEEYYNRLKKEATMAKKLRLRRKKLRKLKKEKLENSF